MYENAFKAEHQPPPGVHTVFCGHTHRPYIQEWLHTTAAGASFVTVANCGSVGLPRDDARFGSFLYWDSRSQPRLTLYRINIEHETAKSLARFGASDIAKQHISARRAERINGTILED
jgi:predicted phosphodiesterase